MISKELLDTVLRTNVQQDDYYLKNNFLSYSYCRSDNEWISKEINIYELVHKCKEWAKYKGYYIHSSVGDASWGHFEFTPTAKIQSSRDGFLNIDSFMGETEPEAIFKACEWILKRKENNE